MISVRRQRGRVAAGVLAGALAGLLALSGCGGGGGDSSSADTAGAPAPAYDTDSGGAGRAGPDPRAMPRQKEAPGEQDPSGGAPPPPVGEPTRQRAIIYTGSVTVRVEQVDEAAAEAIAIATAAGGFVGADSRSRNDRRSSATLELRIPADRFNTAVNELAGLGDEERREIDTEDVTEAVVDLDARIETQRASVRRTRALLAQAGTIAEIVSIERELAAREADLAALEAKKRRLSDLTSLSTISLRLLGPEAESPDDDPPGFLGGLAAGWDAFVAAIRVALAVIGFLLPFLILLAIPVGVAIWLLRRRTGRAVPTASGPTPGAAPPAPTPAAVRPGTVPTGVRHGPAPAGLPAYPPTAPPRPPAAAPTPPPPEADPEPPADTPPPADEPTRE